MGDDIDLDSARLHQAATSLLASGNSSIHDSLDVSLQPLSKVLEHGGSTGQDDVLVQASSDIDWRSLDDSVNDLGEGSQKVGRVDFGVEEDFRGEETLVSDVEVVFLVCQHVSGCSDHSTHPSSDAVLAGETGKVLVRIGVVLFELFDDILADVGVVLFDLLGSVVVR